MFWIGLQIEAWETRAEGKGGRVHYRSRRRWDRDTGLDTMAVKSS